MIIKTFYIPVYLSQHQYNYLKKISARTGSDIYLFSHLLQVGLKRSPYIRAIKDSL